MPPGQLVWTDIPLHLARVCQARATWSTSTSARCRSALRSRSPWCAAWTARATPMRAWPPVPASAGSAESAVRACRNALFAVTVLTRSSLTPQGPTTLAHRPPTPAAECTIPAVHKGVSMIRGAGRVQRGIHTHASPWHLHTRPTPLRLWNSTRSLCTCGRVHAACPPGPRYVVLSCPDLCAALTQPRLRRTAQQPDVLLRPAQRHSGAQGPE